MQDLTNIMYRTAQSQTFGHWEPSMVPNISQGSVVTRGGAFNGYFMTFQWRVSGEKIQKKLARIYYGQQCTGNFCGLAERPMVSFFCSMLY